ncbi:MAG: efflux RND transporter periplasmic adaptor subunit [Thermincola sp.]|jgi:multidrug resistance efflux pump|nr:efflux RND transporter periplasmic adaptor subunit [Thermincola sp.]MDT3704492.1 efflux RND transporter periplasmic adaptor subunit [Thermincola sp.]
MNGKRKMIIYSIIVLMVLAILGVGAYYWYENTYYVSTEDARVTGDIVKVSPQIAGRILEFKAEEGQKVKQGQILGRQEMNNLPDSNLELAIIRAPISGILIKKQANIGEIGSPGLPLAMMVDPDKLYISANIEETKLEQIKIGQTVDIGLDQYPDKKFTGQVASVGQATASTFSLLPTATGGNFTKVVQKIPVKIEIKKTDVKLLPGTNAVIKIHVR